MSYKPGPGLISKIIDLISKKPLAFFIASSALLLSLLPGLMYFEEKYDVRIWFRETDPLIKVLDQFEQQFGNDEKITLAIHSPSGIFDMESATLLMKITERMWKVSQVIRVDSLTNYNYSFAEGDELFVEPFFPDGVDELSPLLLDQLKEKSLKHRVMPNYLVSEDGKSALIYATLTPTIGSSPDYQKIVAETEKVVSDLSSGDHSFYIGGDAAVNDAFRSISASDSALVLPALFILIVIYLLLVFRSFLATLLPLLVTFSTIAMTMGFCFYFGYKMNNILTILPGILIAISIADSVHILVTFFHFLGEGLEKKKAAYYALHKNFVPTFLTSISTMIGFFSLTVTELVPIRQLGLLAGVGCFFAWIISVFFMGPLLLWLPFKAPSHFIKEEGADKSSRWAVSLTNWIDRNKTMILLITGLSAIGSAYLGTHVNFNSNPYEYFSDSSPIVIGNDFVEKNFGGGRGPEIVLRSKEKEGIKEIDFLKRFESFKLWADERAYVHKTVDIIDIIKEMNQNLNGGKEEFYKLPNLKAEVAEQLFVYTMSLPQGMDLNNRMNINNDATRMSILWNINDTRGWLKHSDIFIEKAKDLGLSAHITGKFHLFQRMMDYVVLTFFKSVSMAMILVAFLMMLIFKSFKIGVISLAPNFLPLLFGGALMYFANIDLNIGSSLVASVCLGIAVDDTIHFLSNYYRLKKEGYEEREIIVEIFTYTGSALMVTTIILASGFGLFMMGDFVPNVNFGMLCAVILTLALVIDLFFLPALLLKIAEIKARNEAKGQNI